MRRISKSTRINTHKGQKDKCESRPQRGPRNKQNNAMKKINRRSTTKATTWKKTYQKLTTTITLTTITMSTTTMQKQKLTWSRSQREPVDEQEPKPQRGQTNECKSKPWKDQHMTNIHWAEWTTGSWVLVTLCLKTQGVSSHLVLEPALLN